MQSWSPRTDTGRCRRHHAFRGGADKTAYHKVSKCGKLSGTSGAYQMVSEVYRTDAATTTVRIRPGTRPRREYDQGKDMMARQIYSEKSSAAVWVRGSDLSCLMRGGDIALFANCRSGT